MSKYFNRPTNGRASKREANRAFELGLLAKMGKISDLREQVRIELIPKQDGERSVNWIADFVYTEDGVEVWEDCKGFRTKDYVIKRKLILWVHGKKIRET